MTINLGHTRPSNSLSRERQVGANPPQLLGVAPEVLRAMALPLKPREATLKKDRDDGIESEIRTHLDLEAEWVANATSEMEAPRRSCRALGAEPSSLRACLQDVGWHDATRIRRGAAHRTSEEVDRRIRPFTGRHRRRMRLRHAEPADDCLQASNWLHTSRVPTRPIAVDRTGIARSG